MIRPITFLCFVAACGSGLYLYQEKHRVQVIDHQIERTVRATNQLREQTRMLHAEWTLLNDPERLRQLADQFLTLKTVAPNQFTSLAELDSRLPAVQIPAPPQPEADPLANTTDLPVAQAEPAAPVKAAEPAAPVKTAEPSVKAAPRAVAAAVPPPRPPESHPVHALRPEPVSRPEPAHVAQLRPEPRPHEVRIEPRPEPVHEVRFMPPRPVMPAAAPSAYARQAMPAPQPMGGSLLGMAHGNPGAPAPVPLPRPMPVNVYQNMGGNWGG